MHLKSVLAKAGQCSGNVLRRIGEQADFTVTLDFVAEADRAPGLPGAHRAECMTLKLTTRRESYQVAYICRH